MEEKVHHKTGKKWGADFTFAASTSKDEDTAPWRVSTSSAFRSYTCSNSKSRVFILRNSDKAKRVSNASSGAVLSTVRDFHSFQSGVHPGLYSKTFMLSKKYSQIKAHLEYPLAQALFVRMRFPENESLGEK